MTEPEKKECCVEWKCDCIHHYRREEGAIIRICSCHQKKAEHTQPQWEEIVRIIKRAKQEGQMINPDWALTAFTHHTDSLLHEIAREVEEKGEAITVQTPVVVDSGAPIPSGGTKESYIKIGYASAHKEIAAIIKKHITPDV